MSAPPSHPDDAANDELDAEMDGEIGIPVLRRVRGEPIPELVAIPRDRWFSALAPLSPDGRLLAYRAASLHPLDSSLVELQEELRHADLDRDGSRPRARDALHDGTPIPGPDVERPRPPRRWHQVSIRIPPAAHAALVANAEWLGLRPGQLVRMLVHNGVTRLTYERRRDTRG